MLFPNKLNIGSGKDFRKDFLNLDSDDFWRPDIIYDINLPLPRGKSQRFNTTRFGEIEVTKNMFEKILVFDVLEHIQNIHICMKSCMDLLREGGILEINVPYDLSLGAWQDPFHVRAFNENSWLYYTDWFWYMGWTEARFVKEKLVLNLSQIGLQLQASNKDPQEIIRTPRAVDFMFVQLKKVLLNVDDRRALQNFRGKTRE